MTQKIDKATACCYVSMCCVVELRVEAAAGVSASTQLNHMERSISNSLARS